MEKRHLLIAWLLALAVAGCAPQVAQENAALIETSNTWDTLFNQGDIAGLATIYTEDCRVLPPNQEMLEGRDAVRALFGDLAEGGFQSKLEILETLAAAGIGYQVGRYTLEDPDGAVVDQGKFIEVWKEVDGEWKISNDTWNSDLPADSTGTTLTLTHEVEDAEHWLAAWKGDEGRRALFRQHGASSVQVVQNPENPNLTGLVIEVADTAAFKEFMSSPEAAASKSEDGVKDPTLRMFWEVE